MTFFCHLYIFYQKNIDKSCFKMYNIVIIYSISIQNDWVKNLLELGHNNAFSEKSDEELVELAVNSKTAVDELISRYLRVIWFKSQVFSNSQADVEDLAQEGFMGLLSAVSGFDSKKEVKFSTFADVCISNKMKTFLMRNCKSAFPVEDVETLISENGIFETETPESILMSRELVSEIFSKINSSLSVLEKNVMNMVVKGADYASISKELGITEKSVDNAIQRSRNKLRKFLNDLLMTV